MAKSFKLSVLSLVAPLLLVSGTTQAASATDKFVDAITRHYELSGEFSAAIKKLSDAESLRSSSHEAFYRSGIFGPVTYYAGWDGYRDAKMKLRGAIAEFERGDFFSILMRGLDDPSASFNSTEEIVDSGLGSMSCYSRPSFVCEIMTTRMGVREWAHKFADHCVHKTVAESRDSRGLEYWSDLRWSGTPEIAVLSDFAPGHGPATAEEQGRFEECMNYLTDRTLARKTN